MDTKDYITLLIAITGAILGIINTINSIRKEKINLKIIPQWVFSMSELKPQLEVINKSDFPVYISHFGFQCSKKKWLYVPSFTVYNDIGIVSLPIELKPRNNLRIVIALETIYEKEFRKVKKAVVYTADGNKFYGKSKALKQMIKLEDIPSKI